MARAKKKPVEARRPTYGAATRLARLVHELRDRPNGWSLEAIRDELRITERTLARYLEVCRRELVDARGRPLLEVVRQGDRRVLRFADHRSAPATTEWEVLFLFFALRLARVLSGTILDSFNQDVWERLRETVPSGARRRLENADRKFYALPYMPKSYAGMEDEIDRLLRALIEQYRLVIHYAGLVGEGREHEFDPLSLVEHRGGLYLLGHSHLYRKAVWLAVDRIRSVSVKLDESGEKIHFPYPKGFDPARYTNGMFGIVDGETTRVVLALQTRETEAYLRARQIHPTQCFFAGPDGRTHLEMKVRGTTELSNWIMATSPWVEVLEPASLREEIATRLAEAAALHGARTPARARAQAASRQLSK